MRILVRRHLARDPELVANFVDLTALSLQSATRRPDLLVVFSFVFVATEYDNINTRNSGPSSACASRLILGLVLIDVASVTVQSI